MPLIAEEKRSEVLSARVPADLYSQVRDKAQTMSVSADATVATLLRLGLEVQQHREAEIASLTERLRAAAPDSEERSALGDQLGKMIFGE